MAFKNFKVKGLLKIVVITLALSLFACSDEQESDSLNVSPGAFRVEVVGRGLDCGDTFLIRFSENDENKVNAYLEHANSYYPVFYAVGLPEEFKEEGLILNVTIRQCETNDIPLCTAMGPGYGIVCIELAESLSFTAQVLNEPIQPQNLPN